MHRPLAQRPRGRNAPRIAQICDFGMAPRPLSLCQNSAKASYTLLAHGTPRVQPSQVVPRAAFTLKPLSRSYRFGPSKSTKQSTKQSPPQEAQTGHSKASVHFKSPQTPQVNAKDVVAVVENARDQLLAHDGIPSEQDVLEVLRKCNKAASFIHDVPATHHPRAAAESDTAASSLLSLDGSETEQAKSRGTKASEQLRPNELVDRLSDAAFGIVSHPAVLITPQILDLYVEAQARLGRVESLPHVLDLYASKPRPRGSPGSLQYAKENPDKAANAVDPDIIEKALDATIEAKNLDAAIGVIANCYATKAFIRAKILKKALLPTTAAAATPLAIYLLASNLAHLQNTLDQRTATVVGTVGILTYVGFTGWMGVLSFVTQNDHMKRVTWAQGIPLRERWFHEEERAALDKVACSFGFSQAHRFGEEEGAEFHALREFILRKGMVLDRVELMEGMT